MVQSRQQHVHATRIRCDGRTAARLAQFDVAAQLLGDTIARYVARGHVRLDGTGQHLGTGSDVRPLDAIEDGGAVLVARSLLAEGGDWLGDQARTRHERHFLPVDFASLCMADIRFAVGVCWRSRWVCMCVWFVC